MQRRDFVCFEQKIRQPTTTQTTTSVPTPTLQTCHQCFLDKNRSVGQLSKQVFQPSSNNAVPPLVHVISKHKLTELLNTTHCALRTACQNKQGGYLTHTLMRAQLHFRICLKFRHNSLYPQQYFKMNTWTLSQPEITHSRLLVPPASLRNETDFCPF